MFIITIQPVSFEPESSALRLLVRSVGMLIVCPVFVSGFLLSAYAVTVVIIISENL